MAFWNSSSSVMVWACAMTSSTDSAAAKLNTLRHIVSANTNAKIFFMLYKPLFFSAFAFSALIIPRILEKSTRIYKKLHFPGSLPGFPYARS